jgi:putative membrane protein
MNKPAFCIAVLASLAGCTTTTRPVAVTTTTPAPAVAVVTPAPATTALGASAGAFAAADRQFAQVAASSNMFEIGASQIAPKRTSNPEVLSLASMINQHHTTAMNELMGIMQARGMAIPQDMAPDKRHLMDTLGTTKGAEFDRTFVIEAGVKAHQADIAAFQQQMPALSDPALKDWAARALPLMQQHLAAAQSLASRAG